MTPPAASPSDRPRILRSSRGKEAGLGFLAVFYFVVATNTQSGWLFLLSAFLLGLLALCWYPSRQAIRSLSLERKILGTPQRDTPLHLRLEVSNRSSRPLQEVLVEEPATAWSERTGANRWVIPRLAAGARISLEASVTPRQRGEHRLGPSRITVGAPFGLFGRSLECPESEPFLIYPRLQAIPLRHQNQRLSGVLAEFAAPASRGDSRALRSLREYRAGDDLRLVHWPSTAKNSQGQLLLREHLAPVRRASVLLLDTSSRPATADSAFEAAVELAASLLWSAHRAGIRTTLLLAQDATWQRLNRWEEQYRTLARVQAQPGQALGAWLKEAHQVLSAGGPGSLPGSRPLILSRSSSPAELGAPEDWTLPGELLLLCERPEEYRGFPHLALPCLGWNGHV